MSKKFHISLLLLITLGLTRLYAQEVIPATGGNGSGSGGTISYSIGQVSYTTNTGTNGSVAQGVQQPYEISVITSIETELDIHLSIMVYPNPTSDYLVLSVENFTLSDLSYMLYTINGKLLEAKKIGENTTTLDMSSLQPAIYLLKVIKSNQVVKTFKIIKNNY